MILFFAYNTLMDPSLDQTILGHPVNTLSWDWIPNYTIVNKGNNYKTLEPLLGGNAQGKVLEVSEEDLKKLDRYENAYHRKFFKTASGENVSAYVLSGGLA